MATALSAGFNNPFQAQLDFFRQKLNLPTAAWNDIWQQAHDRAFIVAGAARADLLADLRTAIDQSIASGTSLQVFRKQFDQIVAQRGWTGWTGQGTPAGVAWRTKVIYQTNMATSYAAGRWQQLTDPSMVQARPWWQYIHSDSVLHPRPLHKAWNGLTLRWDDPFWASHFPPNGWGCRCRITAVAKPAAGNPTTPPAGWDKINPTTGAPPGIDAGFAYAPGASAKASLQSLIDRKLINLDAPVGAAMWQALKPMMLNEMSSGFGTWVQSIKTSNRTTGDTRVVGAIPPSVLDQMAQHGVMPSTAEMAVRDEDVLHTFRQSKKHQLPEDWYSALPMHIAAPDAVVLDLTVKDVPALLYVFDLPESKAKLVLSLDYSVTRRNADGKKERILINTFRSGKLVDQKSMNQPAYVWLIGKN